MVLAGTSQASTKADQLLGAWTRQEVGFCLEQKRVLLGFTSTWGSLSQPGVPLTAWDPHQSLAHSITAQGFHNSPGTSQQQAWHQADAIPCHPALVVNHPGT